MSSYNIKVCIVPECPNTSWTARDKVFFCVPKPKNIRNVWRNAINGVKDPPPLSANGLHICEDHFDLKNDLENDLKYKMGYTRRATLKEGVIPSKFDCQRDRAPEVQEVPKTTEKVPNTKKKVIKINKKVSKTKDKVSKTKEKAPKSPKTKTLPETEKTVAERLKENTTQVLGEKTSRGIGIKISRVTGLLESELEQSYNNMQPKAGSQDSSQSPSADIDDGNSINDYLSLPIINDVKTDPSAFDEVLTEEVITEQFSYEEMKQLDIKVCRICLGSRNRFVHSLRDGALLQAYEALTGLVVESNVRLPLCLCPGCARKLLGFFRFRSKGLHAHALLLGLAKKHGDYIIPELLSSSGRDLDGLGSKLSEARKDRRSYDLDTTHVALEDGNTPDYDPNITFKIENEMDDNGTFNNLDNSYNVEVYSDVQEENLVLEGFRFDNDTIKTETYDWNVNMVDKENDPPSIAQEHDEYDRIETENCDDIVEMQCEASEERPNPSVHSKSNAKIDFDLNDSVSRVNGERISPRLKIKSVADLDNVISTYNGHQTGTYSCDYCDYQSCVKEEFMRHVKDQDADVYLCGNCHQSFRLESARHIHSQRCGEDNSVHSQSLSHVGGLRAAGELRQLGWPANPSTDPHWSRAVEYATPPHL